ncbi:MAG: acyltransferase family protein, partial [Clostridia bacterium]
EVSYFESFGPPSPIGHLWSLAVEEQFYLVWPLLVALSLRFVPRHLLPVLALLAAIASALAMVLIYQPGTDPSRVYYGTDTRAFGLLIGAGLAMVWPSRKLKQDISSRARKTLDTAGFLGLGTIILMIFVTNQYDDSLYQGGLVLLSIATAVVVGVLAHPASTMGKMLGVKPLRWIGVRSYGIYLWHYPVIVLTTPATNADGIDLWRVCLQIVLSIALAAVSWRYLEEPIRHGVIGKIISQLGSRKWWRGLIRSGRIGMATALTLVAIGGCAILIERGSEVIASTIWPMQGDHDALSPVSQGHKQVDHSLAGPQKNEQDGGIVPAKDAQSAISDTKHEQAKAIPNHLSGSTAPAKPTDNKSSESPVKKEQKQEVNSTTKHDAQGANTSPAPATDTDKTKPATGSPQKPAVKHYPELTPVGSGEGITAVGDSVMLDIEPYLNKLLPGIAIDGKIGRQMSQASEVITSLKAQGKLGKHVIIQLGTNGPFSKTQLEKLLHSLGDVEQIILVNTRVPRPWEGVVNTTLAEIAAEFPNTTLVDWYTTSAGKNDYFAPDGVHLNIEGSQTYAALVAKAVNPTKTHQEKAVAQAKPQ